jgi:uncharacterized protein (DUF2336 family)
MSEELRTTALSKEDVAKLMADPSAELRVETSAKIAAKFSVDELGPAERQIAEDIFRALVKDVEVRVRESLSVHLKHSPNVPHDIALALARDVDSVALPMLKFSEVLTDDDLVQIVKDQGPTKQVAIAQRPRVSSKVADALIDTGNETAVARLVANEGADITTTSLDRVMVQYEGVEAVSNSLAGRPNLPAAISERLIGAITERLQEYLSTTMELAPDVASNLIMQARERATMGLVEYGSTDTELQNLIEQLHRKGRLTPSLVLRALCVGDLNFFERALAKLGNVPLKNARMLIHDQGALGLQSIYLKAELPRRLFPAFRAGIDVVSKTEYDGGSNDRSRFIERMLERMLTQFEDPATRLSQDDIDYLMGKLNEIAA